MATFDVFDERHCESCCTLESFAEALAEIERRCSIPWDEPPNRAPCKSWMSCGRKYEIREYASPSSAELLRVTKVCDIDATGIQWLFDDTQS
ncbi:MAG: hypothetical protein H6822_01855 [Planctomycetaceae bacterium]|nr:hypothetical protein [Planctomycetales bacterium]MCB9920893.1 hypothetical protein [Planctomycetaceae bacterium]